MGARRSVDLDKVKALYLLDGMSMRSVAAELGVSVGKIYNFIKENDIPAREQHKGFLGKHHTEKAKASIGKAHKKPKSIATKAKMSCAKIKGGIGFKKIRRDGYVAVYFPDHPHSSKDGFIMEHILVMECLIGRHLKDGECVHHKNHKRNDNRKENLELMTLKDHMSLHSKERWAIKKGEMNNVTQ